MYYRQNHRIIESDDIVNINHVHITEEDGHPVAYIKAELDPHKNYQAEAEVHMHLTNGINHRMFGPFLHADPLSVPDKETNGEPQAEENAEAQE